MSKEAPFHTRYSEALKAEVREFVSGIHAILFENGHYEDATPVVEEIKRAVDEAAGIFDSGGAEALASYYKTNDAEAESVRDGFLKRIEESNWDLKSEIPFDLPDQSHFFSHIRRTAARYVATHEVASSIVGAGDRYVLQDVTQRLGYGPRLVALRPSEHLRPRMEEARDVAERLTSKENPERALYRLRQDKGATHPVPSALRDKVADELSLTKSTAGRYLAKSGFSLPQDLRYVRRKENR